MKKTISIFIPHYGCPNDCVFCNQVKISGKKTNLNYELIKRDILRDLSTIKDDNDIEIAFFGGSFTAIEDEVQEKCLEIADSFRKILSKKIQIKLSTRPDSIDEKVIQRLLKYDVTTVELGVQSLDDEVLKLSNRGHNAQDVSIASKLIKQANIKLGLQIMIGLPGDDENKLYKTIDKAITIRPDIARIYPVLVIKDTQLENMYLNGEYTPISLEKAVDLAKYMYVKFEQADIKVIRIGLQATENISFDKDVVAGPFHSAFGELVINEIYKDKIETIIKEKIFKEKELNIYTSKKYISKILGNKKKNLKYFKEKYDITLKVVETNNEYIQILNEKLREKDIIQSLNYD